jgi:hypothetical protein
VGPEGPGGAGPDTWGSGGGWCGCIGGASA